MTLKMVNSQHNKTPQRVGDICRLCEMAFTDLKYKHHFIIHALEVKSANMHVAPADIELTRLH